MSKQTASLRPRNQITPSLKNKLRNTRKCLLIDVPGDHNITVKEIEKFKKYTEFLAEVVKMPRELNVKKIGIKPSILSIQESAMLGSANIL